MIKIEWYNNIFIINQIYKNIFKSKKKKTIEYQGRKEVEYLIVLNPVEHQQKPKPTERNFPKDLEKM